MVDLGTSRSVLLHSLWLAERTRISLSLFSWVHCSPRVIHLFSSGTVLCSFFRCCCSTEPRPVGKWGKVSHTFYSLQAKRRRCPTVYVSFALSLQIKALSLLVDISFLMFKNVKKIWWGHMYNLASVSVVLGCRSGSAIKKKFESGSLLASVAFWSATTGWTMFWAGIWLCIVPLDSLLVLSSYILSGCSQLPPPACNPKVYWLSFPPASLAALCDHSLDLIWKHPMDKFGPVDIKTCCHHYAVLYAWS